MLVEEEAYVLLRLDYREFPIVLVVRGALGVSAALRPELGKDVAKPRIWRNVLVRAEMDAHLGRVVPAKHGTVLDKRDGKSEARGRDRRAYSRYAASNHAEVELGQRLGIGYIGLPAEADFPGSTA